MKGAALAWVVGLVVLLGYEAVAVILNRRTLSQQMWIWFRPLPWWVKWSIFLGTIVLMVHLFWPLNTRIGTW